MPSKSIKDLVDKFRLLDGKLTEHLIESGGIKTQLKFNTWLTGVILVALLGKFVVEWFKK